MNDLHSFGFVYQHRDREFAVFVQVHDGDEARSRLRAMAGANFVGKVVDSHPSTINVGERASAGSPESTDEAS